MKGLQLIADHVALKMWFVIFLKIHWITKELL